MALFRTLGTVLRVKLEAYCCVYIQETDKQLRLPAILLSELLPTVPQGAQELQR